MRTVAVIQAIFLVGGMVDSGADNEGVLWSVLWGLECGTLFRDRVAGEQSYCRNGLLVAEII